MGLSGQTSDDNRDSDPVSLALPAAGHVRAGPVPRPGSRNRDCRDNLSGPRPKPLSVDRRVRVLPGPGRQILRILVGPGSSSEFKLPAIVIPPGPIPREMIPRHGSLSRGMSEPAESLGRDVAIGPVLRRGRAI